MHSSTCCPTQATLLLQITSIAAGSLGHASVQQLRHRSATGFYGTWCVGGGGKRAQAITSLALTIRSLLRLPPCWTGEAKHCSDLVLHLGLSLCRGLCFFVRGQDSPSFETVLLPATASTS